MKTRALGAVLILGFAGACCSAAQACDNKDSAITRPGGCSLSSVAFSERTTEVKALLNRREATRELEDGFAFRFPGDDADLAQQLAALIVAERQCCSFLGFELTLAPEQGPIWLTVSGSQEVKALMASLMIMLE